MEPDRLKSKFLEQLQLFTFFHLGSDVESKVQEGADGLEVSLRHHRIEPLEFAVSYAQLAEFLEDAVRLESFLLDRVTPHRR